MRWDRLFEDLEDQLVSEREAERAALEGEAERLRLSRVTLRDRLRSLAEGAADAARGGDGTGTGPSTGGRAADDGTVTAELADGTLTSGRVHAVGVDFAALLPSEAPGCLALVRLDAVTALRLSRRALGRSAQPEILRVHSSLRERLTLGFVLRDVARRRQPVQIVSISGRRLTGTIDRVGADHLDLALHDAGAPPRVSAVTGVRIVPLGAIASVLLEGHAPALL